MIEAALSLGYVMLRHTRREQPDHADTPARAQGVSFQLYVCTDSEFHYLLSFHCRLFDDFSHVSHSGVGLSVFGFGVQIDWRFCPQLMHTGY